MVAEDLPPQDDPNDWLMVDNLQCGVFVSNDALQLGLCPCDAPRRNHGDHFDPLRVELEPVRFSVASTDNLYAARDLCAERGEPTELAPLDIAVLSITDPDGMQLELTAAVT